MPRKIEGDYPDDPERGLDWALRMERIVDLRSQGFGATKIVEQMREQYNEILTANYVNQLLREYAEQVRDRTVALGEERFAEQDARCEYMYRQIQKKLNSDTLDVKQFAALVCAAIRVLERQARLFGTDKQKQASPGGPGANAWLEHAAPEELARLAKTHGIKIPEKFAALAN